MRKFEKLRCPTCNLKNYDIENENKRARGVGAARGANQRNNKNNTTAKQNRVNDDM